MQYRVKEIFYTLQGEGYHAGKPAVFCRFSGCNLWSGLEKDRSKAICQFCDTDFVGTNGERGGVYDVKALIEQINTCWQGGDQHRFIVCTGGEPLLQLDDVLIDALHDQGFEIAVESNGTQIASPKIDWLCISPKANSRYIQQKGHELKLVYPQSQALPEQFEHWDFQHFYLQPMDGAQQLENTQKAIAYCLKHPKWHLSMQTHKYLNIP
jgi:7-carboxy-7-deazaguanine synthase